MGRINYERSAHVPYGQRHLKLDRMRQLLTRLGQPDAGLKIIHVAGTKGKGSTSAMIAAMLTAAGFRTGVFSSPHLNKIEERFAVDGQPATGAELVALVDRLRSVVKCMDDEAFAEGDGKGGPTYFDITTAMALVHFVERQVDAAVLEVGLGGRLDSTNVCLPAASVITSISFDHTKQLGNTLAAIAREKAGIIKPGVPVISGVTEPEPRGVIAEVAREHGCRLIQFGADYKFEYYSPTDWGFGAIDFDYRVPGQALRLQRTPLRMRGPHQAVNAAVALATVAELRHQGWCVSIDAMRRGLAEAVLSGRVEIVEGDPTVVLDTAHNSASARALVESLAELPLATRRTLVLSVSHDKDVRAIVHALTPHFDRFLITQYQENPRAIAAENLAGLVASATPHGEIIVCHTPHAAWDHIRRTAIAGERVCISGSFYLAAEMRPLLLVSGSSAPTG
jgi:dihydrofolate synthase/folylpolyglutamate synthase